jgi:protein TonB
MLLVFLAPLAAAAVNPVATTHPKILTIPLFHADDYPLEARTKGWQGAVVADVTVNTNGRVDKCDVVQSSGYKLLDDTTCQILIERARFRPARDKNGNPVADVLRTPPVTWAWQP